VWEGDDFVVVDAFHGFSGDHGVDDGFLGGLNGREENWVKRVIGKHGELVNVIGLSAFRTYGAGVGSGES